jgi:hypothetical protein
MLETMLCQPIHDPPPGIPKLDQNAPATDANAQQENVRDRLEAHRADANCAGCHSVLDPIGLGLENFDGIGAYRTKYSAKDTTTIDASGMLPTGETFSSVAQLAQILSMGGHLQELTDCASQKLMTYALSRSLVPGDSPYLNQIRTTWAGQGYGMKALLKDIVDSESFRFRRGEM